MYLVIYGPEGSGKGTQANLLSQKYSLPVYTSGNLVRKAAKTNSGSIGQAYREALEKGVYVEDKNMFLLWEKILKSKEARHGFILDGFPRNLNQAKFLTKILEKKGIILTKFIYLKLSPKESTRRLLARGRKLFTGSKVSHDTPAKIKQRLKTYRQEEKKVLDFFSEQRLVLTINGDKSIGRVFNQINKGLLKDNRSYAEDTVIAG